jgi:hypothetical protein
MMLLLRLLLLLPLSMLALYMLSAGCCWPCCMHWSLHAVLMDGACAACVLCCGDKLSLHAVLHVPATCCDQAGATLLAHYDAIIQMMRDKMEQLVGMLGEKERMAGMLQHKLGEQIAQVALHSILALNVFGEPMIGKAMMFSNMYSLNVLGEAMMFSNMY